MLPNKSHTELFYQIALTHVPQVGPKTARGLIARFGSAESIFRASLKDLRSAELRSNIDLNIFKDQDVLDKAEQELEFVEKNSISLLFCNAPDYPQRFLYCDDAPILLFYKGNANLNAEKVVAVIGTRKNTDYGQRVTEDLLKGLEGLEDLLVVSGLALGIDTIAHRASLKNGLPTVGVVGHGLDTIYPYSNKELANEMMLNGGILSEFPSGIKPDRQNFPQRNRVVAGISDISIIVESDIKGGAMITAYVANGYNREVAAFPGRVYDSKSEGPNHLIKKNVAAMITNADDLLELMNWGKHKKEKSVQKQLFVELSSEERQIVELLQQKDAVHSDELLHGTGLGSPQLAAVLLQLEMQGVIKTLPGKFYRMN
jgi:DNA processing protein